MKWLCLALVLLLSMRADAQQLLLQNGQLATAGGALIVPFPVLAASVTCGGTNSFSGSATAPVPSGTVICGPIVVLPSNAVSTLTVTQTAGAPANAAAIVGNNLVTNVTLTTPSTFSWILNASP